MVGQDRRSVKHTLKAGTVWALANLQKTGWERWGRGGIWEGTPRAGL
jgi:hypothetical protein